jgi:hypothetical protein
MKVRYIVAVFIAACFGWLVVVRAPSQPMRSRPQAQIGVPPAPRPALRGPG